jgi:uncharacterized membrane protein
MEPFLLLGLLVAGGYVLGVIGFFRANTAHTELRSVRRALAELASRQAAVGASQASAAGSPDVAPGLATNQLLDPRGVPATPGPDVHEPSPGFDPLGPGVPGPLSGVSPASTFTESSNQIPGPAESVASGPGQEDPTAPEPAPPGPARPATEPARDLESLLTARWGVWLGSAALLLAGVFLIRYAVEEELLGPGARCVLGGLLGVALLAAAEWLTRHEPPSVAGPFHIDQAPSGLAAGGAAILFGAAYGAGPFYELLPPLLAFAAMAAASFIAMAAALRYGPLTAVIGIAGAFVTPALVTTENPSLPGLFAYLFVVSAAALSVVRYTAWTWLGWATTIAGAAWVWLAALQGGPDLWAAAAFVPAAATLNLFLLPAAALDHPVGRRLAWVPFAIIGAAGLVLEIEFSGTSPRVGLFLLSPIAVWRGHTEPRLDRLPWIAALFGLLTLLLWALPEWNPTGEAITVEGLVEAVLPGAWAPDVIRPLITAAALFAAFHAAVGLWLERHDRNPLHWAALAAAVPVLTLLVAYAQVARFQSDFRWALAALALAAALTAIASRAAAEDAPQRAGIHAAGAAAALALGCAMMLHEHWLTLAISLFLPALAWIEARADLPPLRHVALAVAGLVLIRLVLNWYVLDYAFGTTPLANGLIAAYAVPAAAFAFAAMLFRRRADDLLVATLEAGAVTFVAFFVALEIRHWTNDGEFLEPFDFQEIALHLLTMSVQATMYLHLAGRTGRPMLSWAWRILGAGALVLGAIILVFNPAFTGASVDVPTLLAAYLVPGVLAVLARPFIVNGTIRRVLGIYGVIAGFVWITLQIRFLFHPAHMDVIFGSIDDAELWAWSGAWLLYGIALMIVGIRTSTRELRLAALAVVGLVCAKVFLIDMADLTGLWRVLSFLGLGLALIGLGVVHRRFVLAPQQTIGSGEVEQE